MYGLAFEILAENRGNFHKLLNIIRTSTLFRILPTGIETMDTMDPMVYDMAPENPRTSSFMPRETCMPKTLIAGM